MRPIVFEAVWSAAEGGLLRPEFSVAGLAQGDAKNLHEFFVTEGCLFEERTLPDPLTSGP